MGFILFITFWVTAAWLTRKAYVRADRFLQETVHCDFIEIVTGLAIGAMAGLALLLAVSLVLHPS
jgi:hypothetical protein